MRIVWALIFILPWVALPGSASPYLEAKELALCAGLWALVLWSLFQATPVQFSHRRSLMGWLALYVVGLGLWHFSWAYLQRTPGQQHVVYNVYTWLPTIHVVLALLAVRVLSCSTLRSTVAAQVATQWWGLSMALTAGYALLQGLGLDQFYVQGSAGHYYRALRGSFGNPEYLGLYLALLLPLTLLFRPKRYLVYGGLALLVVVLTRAKGTWLIAGVTLMSFAVLRWWPSASTRRRGLLLVGVGVLVGSGGWLALQLSVGDQRALWWADAWHLLLDHQGTQGQQRLVPSWTGYGLGAIGLLWSKTATTWVHNEWLQALVEIGVLGTGLCLALAVQITRRAWQRAQTSLLDAGWGAVWIGWLVSSVLFPSAHWAQTVWIGLCAWAVIDREEMAHVEG